jgi:hypothetical protein
MEIRTEIRKQLLPLKTPADLSAQLRFEDNAKVSFALRLRHFGGGGREALPAVLTSDAHGC